MCSSDLSFRAYRLGPDGTVQDKREAPLGILQLKGAHFAGALESQVGDWEAAGESTILMSGMIGSRQGWSEAPYVECPAGAAELAARLHPVEWRGKTLWIVPGLVDRSGGVPDGYLPGFDDNLPFLGGGLRRGGVVHGRRGGSAMTAAAVNALASEVE